MELCGETSAHVFDFPGTGRGLAASTALKRGEAFIAVPLCHCLHLEAARAAPELKGIVDASGPRDKYEERDLLCLHLLLERSKGGKSWAGRYLESLPSASDVGLPWTWTTDELSELQGTEVYNHAVNIRDEVAEDFSHLQQIAGPLLAGLGIGLPDYIWARCIQSSRYMKLAPSDGGAPFKALVPGLDMANHSPDAPLGQTTLDSERSMVVSSCGEDMSAGDQIFINYRNDIWNDHLLLTFGFALPKRQLYSCEITFSINVTKAQMDVHQKLLEQFLASKLHTVLHMPNTEQLANESVTELVVKHRLTVSEALPPLLLAMARVQHLPPDQLTNASCIRQLTHCGIVSFVNEFHVLLFLQRLFASKLDELPSDERSDAVTLVQRPPDRKRFALLLRNGERSVLKKSLQQLDASLVVLSGDVMKSMLNSEGSCELRFDSVSQKLETASHDVARLSKWLLDRLPVATLAQVVVLVHLWVIGRVDDPARGSMMLHAAAWPWGENSNPIWVDLDVMSQQAGESTYLELFLDKMAMWGSWFLSQYATCDAISLPEFVMIKQEQDAIRSSIAWSIPTKEALQVLSQHGPLLLLGYGAMHWAKLLRGPAYSTDVVALDAREQRSAQATAGMLLETDALKTLVLLSPDTADQGPASQQAVSKYKGVTLITIGEVERSTLRDSFTDPDEAVSSCFSNETQALMEERFNVTDTLHLPSWPGSRDTLIVWRKKGT